jgi:hypothetical protein
MTETPNFQGILYRDFLKEGVKTYHICSRITRLFSFFVFASTVEAYLLIIYVWYRFFAEFFLQCYVFSPEILLESCFF